MGVWVSQETLRRACRAPTPSVILIEVRFVELASIIYILYVYYRDFNGTGAIGGRVYPSIRAESVDSQSARRSARADLTPTTYNASPRELPLLPRPLHPPLSFEFREVRLDLPQRHWHDPPVELHVDRRKHRLRRRLPICEQLQHLLLALEPVVDQLLQLAPHVVDGLPVPR